MCRFFAEERHRRARISTSTQYGLLSLWLSFPDTVSGFNLRSNAAIADPLNSHIHSSSHYFLTAASRSKSRVEKLNANSPDFSLNHFPFENPSAAYLLTNRIKYKCCQIMISEQMTGGFTLARSPFPLGHTHSLVWFSTDTNLFFSD